MPAPDVPPRHSPLGRAITGLTVVVVGLGTMVGFSPVPSRRAQITVLLVMAGLVVASLWLLRRDQRAYERRLAQETAARAVAEDRLVIARELHDVVSGNLGAITVRCAVAQRLETTPTGCGPHSTTSRPPPARPPTRCGACSPSCATGAGPRRRERSLRPRRPLQPL
ncbi:histidine kinase [Actinomyces naeslundii]|uniref:Histidine kinase dimerization/phosphoacceptor domain protein n=1 Tax=Actinomyces naeslundii (strain ATCC 12104 / DSM 43013 / CCUG 2238 / JCM 8349 / NCTC 10301 / Howell 279) TaxID=1115803 RepID=J3F502_ACTNH|nr:histidine kinase [Actinomyces naeslundii]EJN85997.1 histidine kinase dimerization/phosphoacceptor domain protein [Actinomyces naeslundii str. Howell 279]